MYIYILYIYSYTHILFHILFHYGYHRIVNTIPCAILLFIHSLYMSLYLVIIYWSLYLITVIACHSVDQLLLCAVLGFWLHLIFSYASVFLIEYQTLCEINCRDCLRSGEWNLSLEQAYLCFWKLTYHLSYSSQCCCCVASVMSDSVRPHRRQPTRLPIPGILQARTLEWVIEVIWSSASVVYSSSGCQPVG